MYVIAGTVYIPVDRINVRNIQDVGPSIQDWHL